jgi:hypothetical protein
MLMRSQVGSTWHCTKFQFNNFAFLRADLVFFCPGSRDDLSKIFFTFFNCSQVYDINVFLFLVLSCHRKALV